MDDLPNSSAVAAFVDAAEAFRGLVEQQRAFETEQPLVRLTQSIAELYAASLVLSSVSPTDVEPPPEVMLPEGIVVGPEDHYWEVFDLYEQSEPVLGSLTDDVQDMYRDVVAGLVLFHRGRSRTPCGLASSTAKTIGATTRWTRCAPFNAELNTRPDLVKQLAEAAARQQRSVRMRPDS